MKQGLMLRRMFWKYRYEIYGLVAEGAVLGMGAHFKNSGKRTLFGTSGQDGGEGRYILPPCPTKRRTTTNLKTKITITVRKSNCMEVQQ